LQHLDALRDAGIESEVLTIPDGATARLGVFRSSADADIVFLQKKLFSAVELAVLRRFAKRLVYDFDDAVMFRDSWRGDFVSRSRATRFRRTVRTADLVIAGNAYLAAQAQPDARMLSVLPTSVDTDYLTPAPEPAPTGRLVLGWIGSGSTVGYLAAIAAPLKDFLKGHCDARLVAISDKFDPLPDDLPVERRQWNAERELADLRCFDIGLMPLADDPWTRGKCGFKLLQYFAVGKPCVCSPVGVNAEIVSDGTSGFHAVTDAQWTAALEKLAASRNMCVEMGARGRATVVERYSKKVVARQLAELLTELAAH